MVSRLAEVSGWITSARAVARARVPRVSGHVPASGILGSDAGDDTGGDALVTEVLKVEMMASGTQPTVGELPVTDVHDPGPQPAPVPLPAERVIASAGDLLRALSAPLRIAIVLQLRDGPRCVHELVDSLDATQPLVSQHLKVLKSSGVVSAHRQGREMRYELLDEHLLSIVEAAVDHAGEGSVR